MHYKYGQHCFNSISCFTLRHFLYLICPHNAPCQLLAAAAEDAAATRAENARLSRAADDIMLELHRAEVSGVVGWGCIDDFALILCVSVHHAFSCGMISYFVPFCIGLILFVLELLELESRLHFLTFLLLDRSQSHHYHPHPVILPHPHTHTHPL
jgi:hypothetical protein